MQDKVVVVGATGGIGSAVVGKLASEDLKGSFYTCQAAANIMKECKFGQICNFIGILGKHSMAMRTAYCASKFGAVGFSKCIADAD